MTFRPVHSGPFRDLLGDRRVEFYLTTKNSQGEDMAVCAACVHLDSVFFLLRVQHNAV